MNITKKIGLSFLLTTAAVGSLVLMSWASEKMGDVWFN